MAEGSKRPPVIGVIEEPELLYLISVGELGHARDLLPMILRTGEKDQQLGLRMALAQLVHEGYLRTFCDAIAFLPPEILSGLPKLGGDLVAEAFQQTFDFDVVRVRQALVEIVRVKYPAFEKNLVLPTGFLGLPSQDQAEVNAVGRQLVPLRAARSAQGGEAARDYQRQIDSFSEEALEHCFETLLGHHRFAWALECLSFAGDSDRLKNYVTSRSLVAKLVYEIIDQPVERGMLTLRWMGQVFRDLPQFDAAAQAAMSSGINYLHFHHYCIDAGLAAMSFAKRYAIVTPKEAINWKTTVFAV